MTFKRGYMIYLNIYKGLPILIEYVFGDATGSSGRLGILKVLDDGESAFGYTCHLP